MTGEELRDAFLEFWRENGGVRVAVDGAATGLLGPPHLLGTEFVLDYDRFAAVPITDLEVTEFGIRATLSFARVQHLTFVPWGAVRGFVPRGTKFAVERRNHLRAM